MASSSGASCYYPNGDLSSDGDIPCGSGDGVACCPLNWQCIDNGLCFLKAENYTGRYTCTDQSWKSSGCPNICTQELSAVGAEAILECDPGRYCCDANRPDAEGDSSLGCCNTSNARFSLNNGVVFSSVGNGPSSTVISSVISSAISTSTTSTSSTSTEPSTTTPSPTFSDSAASVFTISPISSTATSTSSPETTASPDSSTSDTSTSTKTSVDQNNNTPEDSTSIILVTSIITQSNGVSSTLTTSSPSIIAAPVSTSSPSSTSAASSTPSSSSKASIIAPAVAVPVAVLAIAFLAFFLWRRKRRQRKPTTWENDSPGYQRRSEPVDMYASQKPHFPELNSPVSYESPDQIGGVSPSGEKVGGGMGTAPLSYRGAGGLAPGDATRVGGVGHEGGKNNRGSELPGSVPVSPGFPQGTVPGSPVEHNAGLMGGGGGLRIANPTPEPEMEAKSQPQPSELPGSMYHPYRPPGGGG